MSPIILGAVIPGFFVVQTLQAIMFARKLLRSGISSQGIITAQRKVSYRTSYYLIPTVKFATAEGTIVEGERRGINHSVEFFDGGVAYVAYDAKKPHDFLFVQELNQTRNYWLLSIAGIM